MPETIVIKGNVLTPREQIGGGSVVVEDGRIAEVSEGKAPQGRVLDFEGCYVVPGFVDIHVHGGAGEDVMDASDGGLDRLSLFLAAGGVTSFLATTYTDSQERTLKAVREIGEAAKRGTRGARLLGLHMEGPYISAERSGAQNRAHIRLPALDELEQASLEAGGSLRMVTLAPEVDGALEAVRWLASRGIVPAAGHTDATYDEARAGIEAGIRHASHLFNGMRSLHHREPGLVGAALDDERVTVELIADCYHIHPAVLRIVARLKGVGRTALVSDSIAAAGLPDGDYSLGGMKVAVRHGKSLLESGTLAGSTIRLCDAVRNMVKKADVPLREAVEMASATPSRVAGAADRKGGIAPGMDADITVLDRGLSVMLTMVEGRVVYEKEVR
jgi:N-acetylglucosamine-6-phosphate deacetylase